MDKNETVKIIRDPLRIAKVAMPPKVYTQDPRVIVATAALAEIEAGLSPARPPNRTRLAAEVRSAGAVHGAADSSNLPPAFRS